MREKQSRWRVPEVVGRKRRKPKKGKIGKEGRKYRECGVKGWED